MTLKHIFIAILALAPPLLAGCANSLAIRSEPVEAKVSLVTHDGVTLKELGKTPLKLSMSELRDFYGGDIPAGQSLELVVEKTGHHTKHYLVPATPVGTFSTSLDIRLTEGQQEQSAASDLLSNLFLAQKFALAGEYDRALAQTDQILKAYPGFARAMSMNGSIYFMKKEYEEALRWYEKALKAQPDSEDAVEMIAFIQKQLGHPTNNGDSPRAPSADSAPPGAKP